MWNLFIIPLEDIVPRGVPIHCIRGYSPWINIDSCHLKSLIKWMNSYHHSFGGYPHPSIMTRDNFLSPIGLLRIWLKVQGVHPRFVTSNYSCGSPSKIYCKRHSGDKILACIHRFQDTPKIGLSLRKPQSYCHIWRFWKHPTMSTAYHHQYQLWEWLHFGLCYHLWHL